MNLTKGNLASTKLIESRIYSLGPVQGLIYRAVFEIMYPVTGAVILVYFSQTRTDSASVKTDLS